mmetsp:Transcript_20730/g.26785  ORF Transcript_20730/g.26785 Transcript_20730/m.26785 type:complete len:360 (-) Transcript_20730:82-1161(-)|eukprot:CAMPEP_0116069638 /NCGR_PEP_ID=MMETSP0322-20121206/12437_1 /TAXON_ID=163516 /ORGANISM="Leptocylindrus danicus var. apora, Strain B651" /LENGTH=359 /DNA_ID=CAMNT_0003557101 /DNA_START=58 /DNA_END=1137 /DNA_ORIENTATION=+
MSIAYKSNLDYDLSNDFPTLKCFVSDSSFIPEGALPLSVKYDYDMILDASYEDTPSKMFTRIVKKVEEKMISDIVSNLFKCDIISDDRGRTLLSYEDSIHIVGIDPAPTDVVDDSYGTECTLSEFAEDEICYPMKGRLTISLTTAGAEKSVEIGDDTMSTISKGMNDDLYVTNDVKKLYFIGNRTVAEMLAMEGMPSASPVVVEPDFVGALPEANDNDNVITSNGDSHSSKDGSGSEGLDFVGFASILLAFLVLLVLLALLIIRRRKKEEEEEEEDEVTPQIIELKEETTLENVSENEDIEKSTPVYLHTPVYGAGRNLGATYNVHNVHSCRSQTCKACTMQRANFISVVPREFETNEL